MARRTRLQSKTDDLAFPVRVKIVVPPNGLRNTHRLHEWLKAELGSDSYAFHSAQSLWTQAAAVYFRTTADADRFLAAFPELELADGTAFAVYYSPYRKGCDGPQS